jgi:hypothetical protein
VAYACDPSYIRGGGWQTEASPGKKHEILIWKITKANGLGEWLKW